GPGSKGGIVLISMWGGVTGIALLFSWSVSRRNPEYILRQANSAMGRQFTSVRRGTSRIGNSVRARLGSVRRTQVP
nr:putative membrane protein [Emiliania huxleyi virus 86]